MKRLFLSFVLFWNCLSFGFDEKYKDMLKMLLPINIVFGYVAGKFIYDGHQEVKYGQKVINCDPIENFEALKFLCANYKERIVIGQNVFPMPDSSLYFQLLKNENNLKKLKEITYLLGNKIKDSGYMQKSAGKILLLSLLAVNSFYGLVYYDL